MSYKLLLRSCWASYDWQELGICFYSHCCREGPRNPTNYAFFFQNFFHLLLATFLLGEKLYISYTRTPHFGPKYIICVCMQCVVKIAFKTRWYRTTQLILVLVSSSTPTLPPSTSLNNIFVYLYHFWCVKFGKRNVYSIDIPLL